MKGQGITEAVFSVGILGLMLTGVVVLILMSMSSKKNDFDRKKASELGTLVLEQQISESKINQVNFWNLQNILNYTNVDFNGFTYSVNFNNNTTYPNCGVGVTNCADMEITVNWQGKNPQSIKFNRFFVKNGF